MGMDVWGRNPSQPEGKYFRANIWSWRPIQALCLELGQDLFDEENAKRIGMNVGAGLPDQEKCTKLADRFNQWLEHHAGGHQIDLGLRVDDTGRFVTEHDLATKPDLKTSTPYNVDDDHLKEWVTFLRHCGGFEIW